MLKKIFYALWNVLFISSVSMYLNAEIESIPQNQANYVQDKNCAYDTLLKPVLLGNTDELKELIDSGIDVNSCDNNGNTVLMYASLNGITNIVEFLIQHNADVNLKDDSGNTALYYATLMGHEEIVRILLKSKVDLNYQAIELGSTVLHIAVIQGNASLVKMFIDANADLNIKDCDGKTPLLWSLILDQQYIAKMLIDAKAQLNVQDNLGNTALMYATLALTDGKAEYEELITLLLKSGANVNINNLDNETVLVFACALQNKDLVNIFLEYDANVNVITKDGWTPLSIIKLGNGTNSSTPDLAKELEKMLLRAGAKE